MRALLAFSLLLLSALPAQADLKACQNLYLNGPKSFGGYRLERTVDYEKTERGTGYGRHFKERQNSIVSLFYYDKAQSRVTMDTAIGETTGALMQAVSAIKATLAKQNILEMRYVTEGSAGLRLEAIRGAKPPTIENGLSSFFRIKAGQLPQFNEYALVLSTGECLVKMRFTSRGSAQQAEQRYDRLSADFLRHYGN